MLLIPISPGLRNIARKYQNLVMAKMVNSPTYTGLQSPDAHYTGYIGEYLFYQQLKSWGIESVWTLNYDGRGEKLDFIIQSRSVDMKTNSSAQATDLMQPLAQFNRHKYDYYVAGKIVNESLAILGFASHKFVSENGEIVNLKCMTMRLAHNKLIPIEKFPEHVQSKEW